MKITVTFLVIAAACCFAPATSNCIRDGKDDEQGCTGESTCLQKAVAEKETAVDAIIQFLCTNFKFKDVTDKAELIKAIQNIEDVSGCTREDIFGSDQKNLEELVMDVDGALQNLTTTAHQLLNGPNRVPVTKHVCDLLDSINNSLEFVSTQTTEEETQNFRGNKRHTRGILDSLGGLGGLLKLLSLLGELTNLLGGLTRIGGGLTNGLQGVTGLLGGIPGSLTSGLGEGSLLEGLTGGTIGGIIPGLSGLTSGLTGSLTGGKTGGSSGNLLGILGLLG